MLIDNTTLYETKHFIIINDCDHNIYYYFDYDLRDYSINMEFQHLHPFFEIMIPLTPDACHIIEGRPYNLQINDIVLLVPSLLHKSIYPKGDPSKRIIISFMLPEHLINISDIYNNLLSIFHAPIPIYRFPFEKRQKVFSILNEIFDYSKASASTENPIFDFYVHTKFHEFLLAIYNMQNANIYKNQSNFSSIENTIYEIASYIHTHYTEPLSLESLAELFYLSPSYLSHQFKEITHFSLLHYIQITRVRNVQYRLVTSNEKISTIAFSCGFTSFSQFNRIFHKISGYSPSTFRKNGVFPR